MATLHQSADGKEMLLVKGAPEVILEHCDRQQIAGGQPAPLDRAHFLKASDRLAAQGERVLGLAWLENPGLKAGSLGPADLPKTLVLLGLVGLLDPPRKEAIEAVKECHGGGIRVTMITGDHKITAAAIAKMLGIGDGKTAVTGAEIEEMDTATLQERVRDVDVFARASPEHKLRLVKAIQANKQIVAMTGDGVNDAPSLKKADIGVAMGIKGTEVTKEAAGMILADDNFASITAAVKEGRTVYNNIEKAMLFLLPTNVAQALVIAVAIFFGFTMPITAPQVLWVNMVTSVALGLVISFEPHEIDVMQRPPRAVDRSIVTGFGIWRIIFVGLALLAYTLLAFFWMKSEGASDELARTVAVNAITIGQVFYLLNSRYLLDSSLSLKAHMGNKYLPLRHRRGRDPAAAVHLRAAVPGDVRQRSRSRFGSGPGCIAGGLVFFLVVEAEKFVIRSSDVVAERGHRGGGRDVSAPAAPNCWRLLEAPGRCKRTRLFAATDKIRGGAPGVTRKRLEAGDGVDARNGFVRGQLSGRDLAQRRAAMGEPQRAQRFGGFLQPDEGCRAQRASRRLRATLSVAPRFDRACAADVCRLSGDFARDRGCALHRLRAELSGARRLPGRLSLS